MVQVFQCVLGRWPRLCVGVLVAVVAGAAPAGAEDCTDNSASTFMKASRLVAPAACFGATWSIATCNAAWTAEYDRLKVEREAATAAMYAFRADCKLRNAREQADKDQVDSLRNAEIKAKKLAKDVVGGDGMKVASIGDPRDNDAAIKRVGQVGLALADIHQSAFGELDHTMRDFATTGIGRPAAQTLRSDGHWNVIAHPPSAVQLDRDRTARVARAATEARDTATAQQQARESGQRAAAVMVARREAAAAEAHEIDEVEESRRKRQERRDRDAAEMRSQIMLNNFMIMNGIVPGGGGGSHSSRSSSGHSQYCEMPGAC